MSVKVVILNGIGSVGKSSTAKALQTITSEPFLHVQGDAFLEMLPPSMMGHPDGIVFETVQNNGKPSVVIEMGHVMHNALLGMRSAVAAMASEGNNLIVDDVMIAAADQRYYHNKLGNTETYFVGLFAPLEVLEQREKDRGDRFIGLARWQCERVHHGIEYDLKVDTSDATPEECAQKIATAFNL